MTNYWFEWHEMFKLCMIHVQCPNDQQSIYFMNMFYFVSIQHIQFDEETYTLPIVIGMRNMSLNGVNAQNERIFDQKINGF